MQYRPPQLLSFGFYVVAKLGALGQPCSDRYNLPCSVVNTLQLSSHALVRPTAASA